jgi:polar amino acid transport system substrate-binding protein
MKNSTAEEAVMTDKVNERRDFLKSGALGLAGGALVTGAGLTLNPQQAAAQASADSALRRVIDRGHLICGTGSTNAPWHFEDASGNLTGMDIAMAKIIAKALFEDDSKVEFVRQAPDARVPNIVTGKVDVCIQFMTVNGQRAQKVNFSRPYYVEAIALLSRPDGKYKTYDELKAAGGDAKASILTNAGADLTVKRQLPDIEVLQLDEQANVIQALDSGRVDTAVVDLSTVWWLARQTPDKYFDAGHSFQPQLYSAALPQGDLDWMSFVNTAFNVAMHGWDTEPYDIAFKEFFGQEPPVRQTGFPSF